MSSVESVIIMTFTPLFTVALNCFFTESILIEFTVSFPLLSKHLIVSHSIAFDEINGETIINSDFAISNARFVFLHEFLNH